MQSKEKIAIFDFCETLANFQTADAYVEYVREVTHCSNMCRKEMFRLFLRKTRILAILSVLFKRSSLNKRFILWQLRGINKDCLEVFAKEYYDKRIRPNIISSVLSELYRLREQGWRIVIASGGYEIYLKYFCQEHGIPLKDLIAVKIAFSENKCLGIFDGGDRLWDKIYYLESKFNRDKIQCVAYSDSITDLPLLQWANDGIVVRRKDKVSWCNKYNLKEIVWSQK